MVIREISECGRILYFENKEEREEYIRQQNAGIEFPNVPTVIIKTY